MIFKNLDSVPRQDVTMEGAKDVKVRVILGPADEAPTFAMRVFELGPGGHTPFHSHPFEHEAVILDGRIASVSSLGTKEHIINDVLLIYPDEEHQFKNLSETESARFMCLVPVAYQK
ncbi:MAG: cupin domain-containing protein [Acidobacteriota bacterium]